MSRGKKNGGLVDANGKLAAKLDDAFLLAILCVSVNYERGIMQY